MDKNRFGTFKTLSSIYIDEMFVKQQQPSSSGKGSMNTCISTSEKLVVDAFLIFWLIFRRCWLITKQFVLKLGGKWALKVSANWIKRRL